LLAILSSEIPLTPPSARSSGDAFFFATITVRRLTSWLECESKLNAWFPFVFAVGIAAVEADIVVHYKADSVPEIMMAPVI
jgi:hypothetical protein